MLPFFRNAIWEKLYRDSQADTKVPQLLKRFCSQHYLPSTEADDAFSYATEVSLTKIGTFEGGETEFVAWLYSIGRNYLRNLAKPTHIKQGYYRVNGKVIYRRREAELEAQRSGQPKQFVDASYPVQILSEADLNIYTMNWERQYPMEWPEAVRRHHPFVKYISIDETKPKPTAPRSLLLYNLLSRMGRQESRTIRPIFTGELVSHGYSPNFGWQEFSFLKTEY